MNVDASTHLARGRMLYAQQRYELAEREVGQALAADPNDGEAYGLLALCLSEQRQHDRAVGEARRAVQHAPDLPFAHYALGYTLRGAAKPKDAEAAFREALRIDPYDADVFGALAAVLLEQSRWADALEAADQGLAIEPENEGCINLRAAALRQLGRREESKATIRDSLARNPQNAYSHANLGWTKLHENKHTEALEHFREALRLNPELEAARAGLVEALKARYFFYRIMLRYFLWLSRLGPRGAIFVILGAYLLFRFGDALAEQNPAVAPFLRPVLIAYIVFAVSTWLASPLFELLLRINRYGRFALSRQQTQASTVLGVALLTVAPCALIGYVIDEFSLFLAGLLLSLLTMPVVTTLRLPPNSHRRLLLMLVGGLGVLAAAIIGLQLTQGPRAALKLMDYYLYGFIAYTFFMNWLLTQPARE